MSFFSGLSALADSFGSMFHNVAEIGLTSRMGESLFSENSYHEKSEYRESSSFGESMSHSSMGSSFGDYHGDSF